MIFRRFEGREEGFREHVAEENELKSRRVIAEYSALNHAAWHAGLHGAYNRIECRILDFVEIETILTIIAR